MDGLYKVTGDDDNAKAPAFLAKLEELSEKNGIKFTLTLSLAEEVKHRIEKASRSGNFSATVEINYSKCSAWSPIDLRCYMKSILMDLGYKVRFPDDRYCKLIIEW